MSSTRDSDLFGKALRLEEALLKAKPPALELLSSGEYKHVDPIRGCLTPWVFTHGNVWAGSVSLERSDSAAVGDGYLFSRDGGAGGKEELRVLDPSQGFRWIQLQFEKAAAQRCNDCNARPGQVHSNGCDVERCARCKMQAIGCNCVYELVGIDVGSMETTHPEIYMGGPTGEMWETFDKAWPKRQAWTGEWPGVLECQALGWYSRLLPGSGWTPCTDKAPDATADLNRYVMAVATNAFKAEERKALEAAGFSMEDILPSEEKRQPLHDYTWFILDTVGAELEHALKRYPLKGNLLDEFRQVVGTQDVEKRPIRGVEFQWWDLEEAKIQVAARYTLTPPDKRNILQGPGAPDEYIPDGEVPPRPGFTLHVVVWYEEGWGENVDIAWKYDHGPANYAEPALQRLEVLGCTIISEA